MTDALAGDKWICTTLLADGTLASTVGARVYTGIAPESTTYPAVIVDYVTGTAVTTAGLARVVQDGLYQVRVVDAGETFAKCQVAIDRIRALLHQASGTGGGGTVHMCSEESELPHFAELIDGVEYRTMGHEFRIITN